MGRSAHGSALRGRVAWAGNTPFKWGKAGASHLGGIRNPMVIAWPKRIKDKGGLRSQFHSLHRIRTDYLGSCWSAEPTDVNGVAQIRCTALALCPRSMIQCAARDTRKQYFAILGNRAMYRTAGSHAGGWIESLED